MSKLPTIKDLAALVRHVKTFVPKVKDWDADNYREEPDMLPSITLTVGWDPEKGGWSWQSGDNSCTGGAYGYPVWAVEYVNKTCNSTRLARDLQNQLWEQAP